MSTTRSTTMRTKSHPSGELRFPLIEVRGAADGPTLTLTAGTHGAEYPGIEAAIRLSRMFDSAKLRGTLRIVPVSNVPGFLGRCEVQCPIDGLNMNRVFPGDPDGSYTEALADFMFQKAVLGSDYLIDMHGGDIFEALVPYVGVSRTKDESVYRRSWELGLDYGVEFVVEFKSLPGASKGTSLAGAARDAGIPAFLAEAGGEGVLRVEDALIHVQGVKNVMNKIGMIDDQPIYRVKSREMGTDFWRIGHEGVVYPTLKLNQHVRPGDPIGVVTDWYGEVLEELKAPREAWVMAIVTTPAARKDAILYQVAVEG